MPARLVITRQSDIQEAAGYRALRACRGALGSLGGSFPSEFALQKRIFNASNLGCYWSALSTKAVASLVCTPSAGSIWRYLKLVHLAPGVSESHFEDLGLRLNSPTHLYTRSPTGSMQRDPEATAGLLLAA